MVARERRKAPTPENTYASYPVKVRRMQEEGKEKKHPVAVRQLQQITMTEVVRPEMARPRRPHSGTQATPAQARGSCSATPLSGENVARQR